MRAKVVGFTRYDNTAPRHALKGAFTYESGGIAKCGSRLVMTEESGQDETVTCKKCLASETEEGTR